MMAESQESPTSEESPDTDENGVCCEFPETIVVPPQGVTGPTFAPDGEGDSEDIDDGPAFSEIVPQRQGTQEGLEGCAPCKGVCENPFDRVVISYLIRGGTRVMWDLVYEFVDPMPYTFQLQASQTASLSADDWVNIGTEVHNVFFAFDGDQYNYGRTNWTHYRVKLETSLGIYFSEPTGALGTLDRRSWRIAKEILRQELVRMKQHAGQKGLLLKRRVTGEDCPTCLDYQTKEVKDPQCPDCWGTGKKCGYFFPIDCVWADIDPKAYRIHRDGGQGRGTINDVIVKARMANTWMLSEDDIWVNMVTDDRYYIHRVQNVAERRGVALAASVEMRPAPVTDVAYDIEIPQQLEAIENV